MNSLHPHKTGLVLGSLLGLVHVGWSLLVLFGWAQPLVDWVFRLHMVQPLYLVTPFSFVTAIGLVVMTAVMGYVMGYVFSLIWNAFHKS